MNAYRRRFVAFTMTLIGIVLLIVFVLLGVFMHRSEIMELENTMRLIIEPWDVRNSGMRPPPPPPPPPWGFAGANYGESTMQTDENGGQFPPRDRRRFDAKGVELVFYNSDNAELLLTNIDLAADAERIYAAVREIVAQDKNYGMFNQYRLIYRYERMNESNYVIALADTSFIISRTTKNAILLFCVFTAAMVLFYFVSRRLSKIAVKPMAEAMEMERQFVADISHDLKTPVTVVLANSSILRSNADSNIKDQLQWVDSTEAAAKKMMGLVNSMLELSMLEGSKKIEKQTVELSQVAEKCILQLESLAYDKGIWLEFDIPEGMAVMGEVTNVEQIISGLIDNAVKYEPDGGKVDITLIRSHKKAHLIVHNNGSFISETDLPHIFERFYRGDKARTEGGHGLGLPILKKRAELIGADLVVKSSMQSGTSFIAVFDIA